MSNPYNYRQYDEPGTNGLAIGSFISAFFVSLLAVILGHIALSQINRTGQRGRGFAIAGLVLGYLGLLSGLLFFLLVVAVGVSGSSSSSTSGVGTVASAPAGTSDGGSTGTSQTVTVRTWGTAPQGVDLTYGSDSDSRQGEFNETYTLPYNDDALYYHVFAQLQGSGDINCSVTVDGKTKEGHASGGYNICNAQLSNIGGDWQ